MAKAGCKKRKIIICIVSIVAVIALLFGACAVYLGDYYHAITPADESFGLQDGSSLPETIKLDNGNIVCKSENATKGLIFYPGGKVEYTAYLPLMESLAQKGILCVLVRMPFNLAVFDVNAADGIWEMFPETTDWYIGATFCNSPSSAGKSSFEQIYGSISNSSVRRASISSLYTAGILNGRNVMMQALLFISFPPFFRAFLQALLPSFQVRLCVPPEERR